MFRLSGLEKYTTKTSAAISKSAFAPKTVRIIEGSLEAKLPTILTDGKAQPGRSSDRETVRSEKIRDGESQKREDAGARKGRKVAEHCVFFPMICGSGGSKSRFAKAAGAKTSSGNPTV